VSTEGYYLKTRVPIVRLISCLPETNKGMDKTFSSFQGSGMMDSIVLRRMELQMGWLRGT